MLEPGDRSEQGRLPITNVVDGCFGIEERLHALERSLASADRFVQG